MNINKSNTSPTHIMINRDEIELWLKNSDYLAELSKYIELPSRTGNKEEVLKCSKFALELLNSCGLETKVFPSKGNPVLFGQRLSNPNNPTILIYGHYDVQPEGNREEWKTDPFQAIKIGDKLFGRGSADNKGQHFAHMLALRYLNLNHSDIFNKINVKFILDGDEEYGSFSLPEVVINNNEILRADFVFVSDGPSLVYDRPTIVGSVRGILGFHITIKHNASDLHSGNFGGLARSAARDLLSLIETMVKPNGEVLIEGFYDDVLKPTAKELDLLNSLEEFYDKIIANNNLTLSPHQNDKNNSFLNQLWPTFNINGLKTGGVKELQRTIIPSEAIVSIDCRLVPNQSPKDIQIKISKHIQNWAKQENISNSINIEFEHSMEPVSSSINDERIDLLISALSKGFKISPIVVPRLGGSLPLYLFPKYLGIPVFLVPYALPDEKNHAPNENLDIPYFESGVYSTTFLLYEFAHR